MEAMDTIVIDVGGSVGGLVTGDIDSGLRGDLLSSGEESLYWRKSVGIEVIGGLGTDIIAGRERESIRGSSLVTGDGRHLPAGCWLLLCVQGSSQAVVISPRLSSAVVTGLSPTSSGSSPSSTTSTMWLSPRGMKPNPPHHSSFVLRQDVRSS